MCESDDPVRDDFVMRQASGPGLKALPTRDYVAVLGYGGAGTLPRPTYVAVTWCEHEPVGWPSDGHTSFLETLHGPFTDREALYMFWWNLPLLEVTPSELVVPGPGVAYFVFYDFREIRISKRQHRRLARRGREVTLAVGGERIIRGVNKCEVIECRERREPLRAPTRVWAARVREDRARMVAQADRIVPEDLEIPSAMPGAELWTAGFRGQFCRTAWRLLVAEAQQAITVSTSHPVPAAVPCEPHPAPHGS